MTAGKNIDSKSDKDLTLNLMAQHPSLVPELFVILGDATNHNFNYNHSSVYNVQEQLSYQKVKKVQVFSSSSPKWLYVPAEPSQSLGKQAHSWSRYVQTLLSYLFSHLGYYCTATHAWCGNKKFRLEMLHIPLHHLLERNDGNTESNLDEVWFFTNA